MADENVGIEASRKEIDQAGKDRGLVVRDGQDVAGTHKGEVVAETEHHVLVQTSPVVGIRYEKESLDKDVQQGERVAIQQGEPKNHVQEPGREDQRAGREQLAR